MSGLLRYGAAKLIKLLLISGAPVYRYQEACPFVKNQKGDELRQKFNQALSALKEDGTLTKLSEQYLKQDVSKEQ